MRHFLSVVATSDASDADRKRSVVAVAENEAACLRYRTEIDVSDRAARALADKARELVVVGGSPDESLESHASHAAAALAEALLRGRDAESAAAEAEFFLDVRDSVIAEQRDAIDALAAALGAERSIEVSGGSAPDAARHDALVAEALRKKASGERRLAFWDHQFEPPTSAAAAKNYSSLTLSQKNTESKARGADPAARVTPHGGARVSHGSRVAAEDAAAMPQTQPRRHDLGADPPRRRPGSGGRARTGRRPPRRKWA